MVNLIKSELPLGTICDVDERAIPKAIDTVLKTKQKESPKSGRGTVYDQDGKLVNEVQPVEKECVQGRNAASPSLGMDNLHVSDFLEAVKNNRKLN